MLQWAIENEISHEIRNDNGVRTVKFTTSEYLSLKSAMFPHCSIHKYRWNSPDGKTHKIDHVLIYKSRHSYIVDVRYFNTDNCLLVAKVRERLSLSKRTVQKFDVER